jgi:hypothetical protein
VVRSHEGRELCTTANTVAEIIYGIERLPEGRRKEVLRSAAAEIFEAFAAVLPGVVELWLSQGTPKDGQEWGLPH